MLLVVSPENYNCQVTIAGIVQIIRCTKSNPGDYSHNIVKKLFLRWLESKLVNKLSWYYLSERMGKCSKNLVYTSEL